MKALWASIRHRLQSLKSLLARLIPPFEPIEHAVRISVIVGAKFFTFALGTLKGLLFTFGGRFFMVDGITHTLTGNEQQDHESRHGHQCFFEDLH